MQFTQEELNKILENHKHWINEDCDGWERMRANLRGADLYEADLREASLSRVDLYGANLYEADLREAKNVPFIPHACPEAGSFIGYKKASNGYIVELEILSDAKRCSATGRKCRCDKAKVLQILNRDRTQTNMKSIASNYDSDCIYTVGEIVQVDNFEENRWIECAPGIHFL